MPPPSESGVEVLLEELRRDEVSCRKLARQQAFASTAREYYRGQAEAFRHAIEEAQAHLRAATPAPQTPAVSGKLGTPAGEKDERTNLPAVSGEEGNDRC